MAVWLASYKVDLMADSTAEHMADMMVPSRVDSTADSMADKTVALWVVLTASRLAHLQADKLVFLLVENLVDWTGWM